MMKHPSLVGILIAALVIYLPIVIVQILRKRPYSNAIAIGGLITVLCLVVDIIFRPLGLVLFLTAHAFGLYLWITKFLSGNQGEEE